MLLNGNVRHSRFWRGPVPMLLIRRTPDHIARTNLDFWAAIALHPPTSGRDDQSLPKRMSMPGTSSTWLEGDTSATRASRIGRLKQRINTNAAGKVGVRPVDGRLCAVSFDFHL